MYNLLRQAPQPLADEKTALINLADSIIGSVETYRKEYDSITENKNSDLKKREIDSRNALNKLAESQTKAKQKLLMQMNALGRRINENIASVEKKATEDIQNLETDYADYEKREKNSLDRTYQAEQYKIKSYKALRKQVRDIYLDVEDILGETFTGKKKLQRILEKKAVNSSIADISEAEMLLVPDSVAEAQMLKEEIKETETLLGVVIYHIKRMKRIRRLAELDAKLETAQKTAENHVAEEYEKRFRDSQERCRTYRISCNNKKEEIINKRDRYIVAQKEKLKAAMGEYQTNSLDMEKEHADRYEEQKKHCAAQLEGARRQWDAQLVQRSEKFVKEMEEEYPAARLNGWMKRFWMHPRRVEDYSKVDGIQMNMLMGVAEVDISSWYQCDTSEIVKKVLANYPLLFGTSKEAAGKAYSQGKWFLPYCISIENGDSVLFSYGGSSEERAKAMVNAVGMRLLRSVPAGMMRFQLFDAVGIGSFGRLMALDPANGNNPSEPIVKSIAIGEGGKVHSSDISKQIDEMKISMDDLATQLTNYSSISEFNANNPLSKQIYRPILMVNFPSGLTENDIKTLNALSLNCRKWGFSMVLAQPDKEKDAIKPESQRLFDELYKNLICLRLDSDEKYLKVMEPKNLVEKTAKIYLYGLPERETVDSIADEIRKKSVEASRVKIEFAKAKGICPEQTQRYSQKADAGIVIPVGYLEGGQPFKMQFDDNRQHAHAIIMGSNGSGKTNLLHVLMTNLMLRYDPSEVMIYLIDFKYGLDFKIYTRYNLPNFRSISITDEPEFALAMLEYLEKEQINRSIQMGSLYQNISEYNADHPNNKMNRIVLIVDELYELVKRAQDEVQKEIIRRIDSIAHQARAFGLHMVICGQDLDKIDRFDTINSQCAARLALHCGDEQVKLLMGDGGVARMHTIDSSDQGACVCSLAYGKDPQIEHTALLASRQLDHFLREIHKHYLAKKQITEVKVLLTRVSDNPNHAVQMYVDKGILPEPDHNKMYVGDPISLERELNFHPQENVWIAGGNLSETANRAANSLMMFAVLSLTLEKLKAGNMDIYCTNFNDHPMRSAEEEEEDRFGQLTSNFPAIYAYSTGNQFGTTLHHLLDELDARQNDGSTSKKEIWWFLAKPELMTMPNGGGNTVIDLKELLQTGPKYNIHTILWNCDVKRAQTFQLTRNLFKERVCLEMSSEEAKLVNGEDLKPMPSGFKAVLTGQNSRKFRIYDLPDGMWMERLFERLKNK